MKNHQIVVTLRNGMQGYVWEEEDGWYGEVADPDQFCQGAAWACEMRDEAVNAVLDEVGHIEHELYAEEHGLRDPFAAT